MLYGAGFVMLMLWVVYNRLEDKIIKSQKLLNLMEARIIELEDRVSEISDGSTYPDYEEDDVDIAV
jgi:hypothetical protein